MIVLLTKSVVAWHRISRPVACRVRIRRSQVAVGFAGIRTAHSEQCKMQHNMIHDSNDLPERPPAGHVARARTAPMAMPHASQFALQQLIGAVHNAGRDDVNAQVVDGALLSEGAEGGSHVLDGECGERGERGER